MKLVVTDSRGKTSLNTDQRLITVQSPAASPTPNPSPNSTPSGTPTPTPTGTPTPTPTGTPTATPTPGAQTTVQFSANTYQANEGCVQTTIIITRSGPTDGTTVARYVVSDGSATQRGDYTYAAGTVKFEPGETQKDVQLLISEDSYSEGMETAALALSNVRGGSLGSPATATLAIMDNDSSDGSNNPIDDPLILVGEHYHDFLNRQSDPVGKLSGRIKSLRVETMRAASRSSASMSQRHSSSRPSLRRQVISSSGFTNPLTATRRERQR